MTMASYLTRVHLLARVLLVVALLAAGPTEARGTDEEIVKQLQQALEVRDRAIRNLLQRVQALEREVRALQGASAAPPAVLEPPGEPAPPTPTLEAAAPAQSQRVASSSEINEEERLAQAALERTLIERGGLLLPSGTLEVESSFRYVHASTDAISIDGFTILPILVIGDIVSERIRREILLPAFTFRLGLPRGFQLEARAPLGYELERIVTADDQERSRSSLGIGDVELALSKQVMQERGWILDLLTSFRWKSTTGRDPFRLGSTTTTVGTGFGFPSLQATLTAVKVRDPVVYFGGFSYTANLPSTKAIGRINPGNPWGVQLGLAMALNLETSISFGWDQRFTGRATLEGIPVPGSFLTEGTFRIGSS